MLAALTVGTPPASARNRMTFLAFGAPLASAMVASKAAVSNHFSLIMDHSVCREIGEHLQGLEEGDQSLAFLGGEGQAEPVPRDRTRFHPIASESGRHII